LGIVFLLFFCREKGLELFNFKEIKNININYFKYGSKGLILNILGQSLYVVDIFFVESYAGDFNLGLYIVAGSIARLLWFFVDAAGTVIFPKLVNNDGQNSLDLISNLSKFSFYINILGIIIFSIFGKFLIEISFGISYAEAYSTIIVLLFASHGMVIYKLVNRYLASRDEWRISYIALGISLFVNILLNFILVPKYQIMGAAIASLVAYWLCGLIIALLSGVSLFKMVLGKISIR
jgi:O-antigen/teichoic acid export membrane protein